MLVAMPWRRQTCATLTPGFSVSCTIARFCSSLKRRQWAPGAAGQIVIAGLLRWMARATSAVRPTPAMIVERPLQVEDLHLRYRYLAKKGQLGFPLSTPKRGTVVPKKGNWRSRKGEPQFPQPYLMNLFMILLKDPRSGNTHKSRQSASTTFGAYIRGRLIEVRLYGPSQGPSKTRRSRTSFLAPCATQQSAQGRIPASPNIQRHG